MRTAEEYATVIKKVNAGFNDCEIARRTGIPRTTVRDWRREGPGTMRGRLPPQGVEWTQSSYKTIQVARRRSVARLESFIGPKR